MKITTPTFLIDPPSQFGTFVCLHTLAKEDTELVDVFSNRYRTIKTFHSLSHFSGEFQISEDLISLLFIEMKKYPDVFETVDDKSSFAVINEFLEANALYDWVRQVAHMNDIGLKHTVEEKYSRGF
jgi:hypothetical protein